MNQSSREEARSEALQHADENMKKLHEVTHRAEQAYEQLVQDTQSSKATLDRQQNSLRFAQLAQQYFVLTLDDAALDSGQHVVSIERPFKTTYFSSMSLPFQSLRLRLTFIYLDLTPHIAALPSQHRPVASPCPTSPGFTSSSSASSGSPPPIGNDPIYQAVHANPATVIEHPAKRKPDDLSSSL